VWLVTNREPALVSAGVGGNLKERTVMQCFGGLRAESDRVRGRKNFGRDVHKKHSLGKRDKARVLGIVREVSENR